MERFLKIGLCFCGVGALSLLVGFGMFVSKDILFDMIVKTQLAVSPTSGSYPMWQDLPAPIKTSMFVFNVTNVEDFTSGRSLPKLVEVGPYVFDEYHTKVGIQWNEQNNTATYKQVRKFFFRPEESTGSLDDALTILNIPAATVGASAARLNSATRGLIDAGLVLSGEDLFVTKTAREILFEGYNDNILSLATFLEKFNIKFPGLTDKFGFYYGRNGSDWWDGIFNMFTGVDNPEKLGSIATWNNSKNPGFFPVPCGDVEGAGDFFPPNLFNAKSIKLYSNDLCRSIVLNATTDGEEKGVAGVEYRITPTYFGNKSVNPSNWCYENGGLSSLPSGVYNASACRFGAPIFMSQPHFYQADPYFLDLIEKGSLSPNQTQHETSFLVEQNSGIPLRVKARFQVNVLVENIPELKMFKKVQPKTYFPVIWFESKFELIDSLAFKMWLLSHLKDMMSIGGLLSMSIGLSLIIISSVYILTNRPSTEIDLQSVPILNNEESSEPEDFPLSK